MSNTNQNAVYAILADSAYWDIREENNIGTRDNPNRTKSNWTPVPQGWKLIKEYSGSGKGFLNPDGFTTRAYKNGNFNSFFQVT